MTNSWSHRNNYIASAHHPIPPRTAKEEWLAHSLPRCQGSETTRLPVQVLSFLPSGFIFRRKVLFPLFHKFYLFFFFSVNRRFPFRLSCHFRFSETMSIVGILPSFDKSCTRSRFPPVPNTFFSTVHSPALSAQCSLFLRWTSHSIDLSARRFPFPMQSCFFPPLANPPPFPFSFSDLLASPIPTTLGISTTPAHCLTVLRPPPFFFPIPLSPSLHRDLLLP